jgi:hypothetical protein
MTRASPYVPKHQVIAPKKINNVGSKPVRFLLNRNPGVEAIILVGFCKGGE